MKDATRGLKVLVVSQYYPPEHALIPSDVARGLSARGHEVRVLTGYPNYPAGRLYEGFTQHWRGRTRDGELEVTRVPLFIDHSQSAARRSANYLSFGLTSATARRLIVGADVVYVYATQMTAALGPWFWRLIGGTPYVLHVQDLWPDSITGSSLVGAGRAARLVDALLTPWLSSVYRKASAIIGIAPTMVDTLIKRGVSPEKTHLVYNWGDDPSEADRAAPPESVPSTTPGTHILYAGNVGDMQDLETAVSAAHKARDQGVRLTIVGDGVALPQVRRNVEALGCTNVQFIDRLPPAEVAALYAQADFALVSLKDLPAFHGTIPSKFQASLAHGIPVISSVPGDLRALVDTFGVGFTAEPESTESMAAAFRTAAGTDAVQRAELRSQARRTYEAHFSRKIGFDAIEAILSGCVTGSTTGEAAPRR